MREMNDDEMMKIVAVEGMSKLLRKVEETPAEVLMMHAESGDNNLLSFQHLDDLPFTNGARLTRITTRIEVTPYPEPKPTSKKVELPISTFRTARQMESSLIGYLFPNGSPLTDAQLIDHLVKVGIDKIQSDAKRAE